LKELTVTPVLLSLICWVLQDAGELPSQVTDLYRKGIRLLLERWNDRKDIPEWEIGKTETYRRLSVEQKEALLIEIAVRKFESSSNFVLFEQTDLTQQIASFLKLDNIRDGEAVLRAIETQDGLLVERADELWSFSHLTFQEYFVATYISVHISAQNRETIFLNLVSQLTKQYGYNVFSMTVNMLPNADCLLCLMKQKIDDLIKSEDEIQKYLIWLKQKSLSVSNGQYKLSAIRTFYFYLELTNFSCIGEFLHPERKVLAYAIDNNFRRAMVCGYKYGAAIAMLRSLTKSTVFDFFYGLANDEISLDIALASILDDDIVFFHALGAFRFIFSLELRLELKDKLDSLIRQIPNKWADWYKNKWADCDEDDCIAWQESFRSVVANERGILRDWQFSEEQKQKLQQYYDANKLLVSYLNLENIKVSPEIKRSIEDNLLLPIATLQQRLPDQYS
jgi:hypothetical protein